MFNITLQDLSFGCGIDDILVRFHQVWRSIFPNFLAVEDDELIVGVRPSYCQRFDLNDRGFHHLNLQFWLSLIHNC